MSGKLTIVQGDATKPQRTAGTVYLPHCCNDAGGWGSGFVNAITARWGEVPRASYKAWHLGMTGSKVNAHIKERGFNDNIRVISQTRFFLGGHQYIQLPDDMVLVNMVGQHNYGSNEQTLRHRKEYLDYFSRPPVRYGALAQSMFALQEFIESSHIVQNTVSSPLEQPTSTVTPWEIHCPKFGSDLAGGDWNVIEQMIFELWVDRGSNVTVYEWIPK